MATSDGEKLIENWASAWSSPATLEKLLSLFTDDCVYEDLPMGVITRGKAELEYFYNLTRGAFPDFKIELTSQFVADNRAGAEWLLSGTHQGDLPGLPATNKRISVRGASAFELQGNKLKRCSDYFDMATALKQIGVLPA
ncbi:MAG TPA: ester cyclase [Ktedonosporobacter sp.]|nr:ester cyclase [Ktedonosporobacter sp.]